MAADTVNNMIYSNSNNCECDNQVRECVCNAAISAKRKVLHERCTSAPLDTARLANACWRVLGACRDTPQASLTRHYTHTQATQWVLISLPAVAEPVVVLVRLQWQYIQLFQLESCLPRHSYWYCSNAQLRAR